MKSKLFIILVFSIFMNPLILCSNKPGTSPEQKISQQDSENYKTPINQWIRNGEVVGAEILIIQSGDTLIHEVAGWRDRERDLLMEKNTICRVRSMTKPFVGTAILVLYEQGKLLLSDRASKYISAFDNEKCHEITIEQLLKHTAGFTQPGYPGWASDYNNLQEIVEAVAQAGPTYPPHTKYSYSDGGSSTLAAIVTEVSGMPVEDFIQTKIFVPLGMKDSFCILNENDPRRSRISCTYSGESNNWVKYWDNNDPPQVPFFRGSGGIYSTVSDYARFLEMWMNYGTWNSIHFLDSLTVKMALTPSTQSLVAHHPYGLHWRIYDDPVFSHTGSDGTLGSADPSKDFLVLYFTQSRGNSTLGYISDVVANILDGGSILKF
jgi:CubicO group peptidase (beta-lactamase class C family)